jgi:acyl carrier protein
MNPNEIREKVLTLLCNVAPEADPASLKPGVPIREQLDVDSMDLLNFLISLHREFNVEIPERDSSKLMTLDGCVQYLYSALGAQGA